ncbi:hypothetical protein B0T14DRAFT_559145 [Immersiella caudata]|uniref:BTB domain-containing protein n=1 Tax=Immersiella caudata TaxID=314043 RepID=A0AA39XDE1_9PEZI|nr:hypothetical protein B0T14DRAFT_559145 [Immersiella caudata]
MYSKHLKRVMSEISNAAGPRERDEFTNFVLVCGTKRFPVHKIIIYSQSKVLRAACSKPFREAAIGEYGFVDQSPILVRRLAEYFYTGDYKDWPNRSSQIPGTAEKPVDDDAVEDADGLTSLHLHAQIFALAEMYQVDSLHGLAAAKYDDEVVGTAMPGLLDSIPDAYDLTPSSVRALRDKAIIAVHTAIA